MKNADIVVYGISDRDFWKAWYLCIESGMERIEDPADSGIFSADFNCTGVCGAALHFDPDTGNCRNRSFMHVHRKVTGINSSEKR